jgi:hypothetical protein
VLALFLINVYIKSMTTKLTGRGGAGRGQGRKPSSTTVKTVPVAIRMTVEQRDKLQRLGGAPWVRDRIDKARLPEE